MINEKVVLSKDYMDNNEAFIMMHYKNDTKRKKTIENMKILGKEEGK